eukprot:352949-Chlamydomonas_euryale.AAC.4
MVVVYVQVCASMCMLWHEWFQATRTPASHASPEEVPAGPTPHTASSRRTHIRLSHVHAPLVPALGRGAACAHIHDRSMTHSCMYGCMMHGCITHGCITHG